MRAGSRLPAIARRASRSTSARPGRTGARRAGLCLFVQRRADRSRSLWLARGAALRLASGRWARTLIELPVTTVELAGRRFAAGGGGFFRLLPYRLLELGDRPGQRREERPAVFYFHPWEIDPGQPRVADAPLKSQASPLHQSRRDGGQAAETASRPSTGAGPTRSPRPNGRGCDERARARSPLVVRAADPADAADRRLRRRARGGRVFHRPQWSRAVERGTGQRAHYLVAEQGGALSGCCRSAEVRSPLFGDALVSAGFGVGGGILADDERRSRRAGRRRLGAGRRARLRERRAARRPGPGGLAARRPAPMPISAATFPADADALLALDPAPPARRGAPRADASASRPRPGNDRRDRDAHYRVYSESVRNLGTPVFPRACSRRCSTNLARRPTSSPSGSDGRPLAALLTFYFNGMLPALLGRRHAEARAWRANDLIYYELMRQGDRRAAAPASISAARRSAPAPGRARESGASSRDPAGLCRARRDGARRERQSARPEIPARIAAWQQAAACALANRLGPLIARGLG